MSDIVEEMGGYLGDGSDVYEAMTDNTSTDERPDKLMKSLGFWWDPLQYEYRNNGRKQFDRDYDDIISLDLAKQLTSYIKQRELALLEKVKNTLPTIEDYDDTDPYQQGYMWAIGQAISTIEQVKERKNGNK